MKHIIFIKFLIPATLLLACSLQISAQTKISNIWAEEQGSHIAVHYILAAKKWTNIKLQYSVDDGDSWIECKSVTGNLRGQYRGNKTILWDCRQDGFEGGSLLFKVIAHDKKNILGLDLGIGARKVNEWATFSELGIRYTHNFSPYIGWDIVNIKGQIPMGNYDHGNDGLFQAMTGLRAYSPAFTKDMKGYASLKGGYGCQPRLMGLGFAGEFETGLHFTKTFFMGFVYNFQNLQGNKKSYYEDYDFNFNSSYAGLRIGFNF